METNQNNEEEKSDLDRLAGEKKASDGSSTDEAREDGQMPKDVSKNEDESVVSEEDTKKISDDVNTDPEFANDDDIDQEVPVKRENTLQRIREDYDEPAKGAIREAIQNGTDAWGENRHEGVLNEDATLRIRFNINTDRGTFIYQDNAGGMTSEILTENLLGIDTPDETKETGNQGGAYGRGFYVVSTCGEGKTYVETCHEGEHVSSTVSNVGRYSKPSEPTRSELPSGVDGTYIHVQDVEEHIMDKFQDWGWVEDMLLESFTMLLIREDVVVEYVIDGETHHPNPPDLKQYLEEGQLIYKKELPEFSAEGDTYQIRDFYVIRTDAMDEDPPWEGVAMLKGGQFLDEPYMTVNPYKPTGIPSLRRPPEMIGWCDAGNLCPDLENNSHTSFRGHESETGIKEVLMQLHEEHFKKGRTTEERQELASDITNSINEMLVGFDDFDEYQIPDGDAEADKGGEEDDGPEGDDDEPSVNIIRCQAGKREFDVGEEVPLEILIENPKDAEHERYEIHDIQIGSSNLGFNRSLPSRVVDVSKNQHEAFDVQKFRPTEDGIYSFSAKVRPQPEVMGMEEEEHEVVDTSRIYFRVGDVDRSRSASSSEDDEEGRGDENTRVSVVRDTSFYPGDDNTWKAVASENSEGGLDLTINSNQPEWLAATRITDDDDRRDNIQQKLGTKWGIEEVILQRNIDQIHEMLGDYTVDGEKAAEIIEENLKKRSEIQSELDARIADEMGTEYGN